MMDIEEFKALFSKAFNTFSLWARQSTTRSIITILLAIIVGFPLIEWMQNLVRNIPYFQIIANLLTFLLKVSPTTYLIIFGYMFLCFWVYSLHVKYKKDRIISDSFNKDLNRWSVPHGSGWTIQESIGKFGKLGKMLSVTNSPYPGVLKDAYHWYDYELNFLARIAEDVRHKYKQNFTFVVRAEDNYNGIMFQITKTHINPHLLYNSTYIRDTENNMQLPTILKPGIWMKVKVIVVGNLIDIYIDDFKLSYKVPSKIIAYVRKDLLTKTPELKDLQGRSEMIEKVINEFVSTKQWDESPAKEEALEKLDAQVNEITASGPYDKVVLEYQKGSVGFRESGEEHAFIKDFKLSKM